jgi:multiple sugar transport system substrate-binding protein
MGGDAPMQDIHEDQKVPFKIALRPVPQFDPEHPQMISQGPSICIFNKKDPGEVLAAWLFTQYLLTDSIQTAYAETEGYVPVTEMARESAGYKEYLNSGLNDDLHYKIKLDATKLLLENTGNTFVTPVFNGSTSLRDASGALIESVVKSVRRKETLDIDKLYDSTSSLYRLDQIRGGAVTGSDQGPLPVQSVVMLSVIGGVWLLIGITFVIHLVREHKLKRFKT